MNVYERDIFLSRRFLFLVLRKMLGSGDKNELFVDVFATATSFQGFFQYGGKGRTVLAFHPTCTRNLSFQMLEAFEMTIQQCRERICVGMGQCLHRSFHLLTLTLIYFNFNCDNCLEVHDTNHAMGLVLLSYLYALISHLT